MQLLMLCLALSGALPLAACFCKCEWTQFNASVNGKLIETSPVAEPCYPGPELDEQACKVIAERWSNASFEAAQPLGYAYPLNVSCPLPQAPSNETHTKCTIGHSPVYAVNISTEEDIARSIQFAKEKSLRLVIKSTGHDVVQRSTGYGSLSIWLYYYRDGFKFFEQNPGLDDCPAAGWNGSTLTITGAYAWSDIYPAARDKGVIVVGGLDVGPCSTGGWTQGGGHGPVTRYFGVGADQVLSARVVLASGEVVTASACENKDLFYAIRGGGGGTYGVVTQISVKTYPTTNVDTIDVSIGSVGEETVPRFLDAVTTVYSSLPSLSKAGFAGYGNWGAHLPKGIGGSPYTNMYSQSFTLLGSSTEEADRLSGSFREEILRFNGSESGIEVIISRSTHPDYWSYYFSRQGTELPVGGVSALASHFLDTAALNGEDETLRNAIETIAGAPGNPVFHTIVHHGLEAAARNPSLSLDSAVQPGWYNSILFDIFELAMVGFDVDANIGVFASLRNNIVPVYHQLSPNTGTYMNEADWGDANWREDFFGPHWTRLNQIKAKYDKDGVFYCHVCVGSDAWFENEHGALCRR